MGYDIFKNKLLYLWLAIITVAAIVTITAGYFGYTELYAQMMLEMNDTAAQQHAQHTLDNLIIQSIFLLMGN